MMEVINRVCARLQDNRELISEFSLVMQENTMWDALNCDIDVPCIVQLVMSWYPAPTGFNSDLLNDDVILVQNRLRLSSQ